MEEGLTLTAKEERRARALTAVLGGDLGVPEAAAALKLSERQVWRLMRAYRAEGPGGLVHGNRGRSSPRRLPEATKTTVGSLAKTTYRGFNTSHLTETLAEHEDLSLGRSTVQRILQREGLTTGNQRRGRHRSWRERREREGQLLQLDGSHHKWVEDRGPQFVLLGAIDDATGTIAAARFHPTEDTRGYLLLLEEVLRARGRPIALYSDKHSIFRPTGPETIAEQLSGQREPSQFGRAMGELGIALIYAHSPQAKGRIERLWGTLQSRLVSELRLNLVSTLDDANAFLKLFIPRFNARFGQVAANRTPAYQPLAHPLQLRDVLCIKHFRIVGKDNTVRCYPSAVTPLCFLLLPGPQGRSFAGKRVEIRDYPDGATVLLLDGHVLAARPLTLTERLRPAPRATPAPPPTPVQLEMADFAPLPQTPKKPSKPAPSHPWRNAPPLTTSRSNPLTDSLGT